MPKIWNSIRRWNIYNAVSKRLPVGVAQAGAWKYSHIYAITTSHFPELAEQARKITELQARMKLLELYFDMVGAAQVRDVQKLFGWGNEVVEIG